MRDAIWEPWQATTEQAWNVQRVVHLHRRAGFGATWAEIQRDLDEGPDASIARVLGGKSRIDGVPADFERMAEVIGDAAVGSNNPARLKAWWLYRMMSSPDPLTEKLTLMWHNHFATSNLKVDDLDRMRVQNDVIRRFARAPFGELLHAVIHDPAMLIWLDADSNRRGAANENLARELMELFTLGIGNYTEQDVKQGARALTGWTIRKNAFFENVDVHDDGPKTILNQTGRWRGNDLLRILLEHKATAHRLTWRICHTFFGEGSIDDGSVAQLASELGEHNLDIGWAIERVLRSKAFFSNGNIGTRVSDPIEFTLGAVRALEAFEPPPSTLLMAEWVARLGQDLFYPPNVGGWSGGRDWLATHYIVARANYAAALTDGRLTPSSMPLNLRRMLQRHRVPTDLSEAINAFNRLLLGERLSSESRRRVVATVNAKTGDDADKLRWVIALMLSLPEGQLT